MKIDLELPQEIRTAILKLPERTDPQYSFQQGGPIEHLAHTKDRLLEYYIHWIAGGLENKSLESRAIPLSSMDILFWENHIGGFKRAAADAYTVDWGYLSGYPESPWSEVYDVGDNAYKWWQVTMMLPSYKLGPYGLWCIETNSQFIIEPTNVRTNQNSDFDLFFAKTDEIDILKKELDRFK